MNRNKQTSSKGQAFLAIVVMALTVGFGAPVLDSIASMSPAGLMDAAIQAAPTSRVAAVEAAAQGITQVVRAATQPAQPVQSIQFAKAAPGKAGSLADADGVIRIVVPPSAPYMASGSPLREDLIALRAAQAQEAEAQRQHEAEMAEARKAEHQARLDEQRAKYEAQQLALAAQQAE